MICLNGNQVSDCEGLSLEDFIETVQIKENDVIEVVSFVGGG